MQALHRTVKRALPRPVRRRVMRLRRMQTAGRRVLPDFVILGTQKGGTSSLYAYLLQHPQVLSATTKEVHFFDTQYERGLRWYRSHFPTRAEVDHHEQALQRRVVTGEASPYYLFHPHAPDRMVETLPDARLIVLLRDPVARAYSHYRHMVKKQREPLSFEEAIAREGERLRGELERMYADPSYVSYNHAHYSYRTRGHYLDQLEAYAARFGREQILVLKSEDFFSDVQGVYDRVLDFLGLDRWTLHHPKPRNVGGASNGRPDAFERLYAYFAPHNRRLYGYLGEHLGWPDS